MSDLRWYPRLKLYKYKAGSTCTFNPITCEAYSYGHWKFVKKIRGKVIFNNYQYSHTTRRHQYMVQDLLKNLGIKIDIYVYSHCSLNDSLFGCLDILYHNLFIYEIANKRKKAKKNVIKRRENEIALTKQEIKNLRQLGATLSKSAIDRIKSDIYDKEKQRLEELAKIRAERKRLRDQIKQIAISNPNDLDSRDLITEPNSEIRRALVNKIGIARVLKDLDAKIIDKVDNYELVDLKLNDNEPNWRHRPYLKMINPSTGDVHIEGVLPNIKSVKEALLWRNNIINHSGQFVPKSKLITLT